ncbi:MAG: hemerythrin family protein [Chromatiales bacterium]|jgi:hemerythrin-like metal-binding protein
MEKIIWSEKYNTGSAAIDKQHQRFVELLNILLEHQDTETDPELLTETVEKLMLFTEKHFADEEKILAAGQFPDVNHHRDQHLDFIESTAEQFTRTLKDKHRFPEELTKLMHEMWIHHMEEEIPEFRAFFLKK